MRGIQIIHRKEKSYIPNESNIVTRIEVKSELYDFDQEFQKKTINTQYREYCEMINNTLKSKK